MKISTEIGSAAQLVGEEKAVEYVAKAGFDAWDFSMFDMCGYDWRKKVLVPSDHPLASVDYLKFARKLKQIGLDNGIVCNQSHAPFPSIPPMRPFLKRAIECTVRLAVKSASFIRTMINQPRRTLRCILICCPLRKSAA